MSTTTSSAFRRFPLHWVFKIGSLDDTMRFYTNVFDMKLHRHEEFGSGCEATCNGPYGGAWSKTMIGYGTEITNTALELTFNYGIDKYTLGNDYRYIAIAKKDFGERAEAGGFNVTPVLPGGYQVVTSPDGYPFLLVPGTEGSNSGDPFLFVSLNVTNLQTSLDYYKALGFTVFDNVPGSLNTPNSVVLGFERSTFKIELVELPKGVVLDHKKGIGRLAIETDDDAPIHVAETVKGQSKGKICHGPFKLPPHDEHVVIISDPDGYEYCFVGITGYRNGSLSVKTKTIDWEHRKKLVAGAAAPAPVELAGGEEPRLVKEIVGAQQYEEAMKGKLLTVLKFSAKWCIPCRKMIPAVERLAETYNNKVVIYNVDVNLNLDFADVALVETLPTFKFIKDGAVVAQLQGSDVTALENKIKSLL